MGMLLFVAGMSRYAVGATPSSLTTPPNKTSKAKAKKPKKTATAKTATVKKVRTPLPVPAKPSADIPLVTETASVWQGCLESPGLPVLASRLGMDESRLGGMLTEEGLLASDGGKCVPYVAGTGGEGGVASAMFQRTEPQTGSSAIVAVRKTADGVTVTPGACDCPEASRRALSVNAGDLSDPSNEIMAGVPRSVRWQLDILVPRMIAGLQSAPSQPGTESDFAPGGEPGTDPYTVRVTLQRPATIEPEHLESVEIIESATGKRLDGAWWLDRPNGPGVLIGMEGAAYERLLWQSPVKYVRQSRGVGLDTTTVRQRVAAPKGSGKTNIFRYATVRVFHIGVDLTAARGVEVHAVGNATVAFAGRMGGYGNLIILNHGLGYQTYYAHLSVIGRGIKTGASVSRGEIIGQVGSTGHSTAPHLHFETRKDGLYIDPFDETRQLGFWLLTADDQERLAIELLAAESAPSHVAETGTVQTESVTK